MTAVALVGGVIAVASCVNYAGAKLNNVIAVRRGEDPPADWDELHASAWMSFAGVVTAGVAQLLELVHLS